MTTTFTSSSSSSFQFVNFILFYSLVLLYFVSAYFFLYDFSEIKRSSRKSRNPLSHLVLKSLIKNMAHIYKSPFPDIDIPEISITEFTTSKFDGYGDRTALVDGASGRSLTYKQLASLIRKVR